MSYPSATTTTSLRAVVAPPASIGECLRRAVTRWGPRVALRRRAEALRWSVMTWAEMGQEVEAIAAGLLHLGVRPGEAVGLLSNTRLEWTLIDYAILLLGAHTVPIYHSSTPAQAAHVLADSGAVALFVDERTTLERLRPQLDSLPHLRRVVVLEVMDLRSDPRGLLLDELIREGRRFLREHPGALQRLEQGVDPNTLASIVYTSGTTGRGKGVRLTHRNLLGAVEALDPMIDVGPDDTTVLCLPLSHIYARLGQFAALRKGFAIAYAQRIDRLSEVLLEVRPTFFFAVPRIYERIYNDVVRRYRELPGALQALVRRGVDATRERKGVEPPRGETLPAPVVPAGIFALPRRWTRRVEEELTNRAIFQPVRDALGGRVRFCVSGGAPLQPDVARFFRLAGIEVLEGFGLTETVGAGTLNPLQDNRIGTVGRPLPGLRVRIAADGEVLLAGPVIFDGYHNLPEETSAVLDDQGWLHTGDVGRLDEAGYLVITDRKKDILVLSGAKNVAPQQVEATMRASPFIADAMVFGDRRPSVVALLVLDLAEIRKLGDGLDLSAASDEAILRDPRILKLVGEEVERLNQRLAPFEQVRKFRLLPRALTIEGGELTPTLKVRRQAIEERFRPIIEAMYEELPRA